MSSGERTCWPGARPRPAAGDRQRHSPAIVHMLEAVQVQREHGQGPAVLALAAMACTTASRKRSWLGRPSGGPSTPGGGSRSAGRQCPRHVVERARQVADLVRAVGVLQRCRIHPRDRRCVAASRRNAAWQPLRHQARANGKQQHTRHGDDGQQHLQLPIGATTSSTDRSSSECTSPLNAVGGLERASKVPRPSAARPPRRRWPAARPARPQAGC